MKKGRKILVAEDDLNLGFLIMDLLEGEGYDVKLCKDGESAYTAFKENQYDLCLLDVMMPLKDGFTLGMQIRKLNTRIPIIFLTARALKEDRLKGFNLGADDYIIKPFDEDELLARIEAVLRRSESEPEISIEESYQIGKYIFEPHIQQLTINGNSIRLTERETKLLAELIKQKNKIIKREDLLLKVWGKNDYFLGRSLDVFITKLRKYLKEDGSISIENIHGVGFQLMC
jgi:DNA-binding response OmpR family regulator